MPAVTIRCPHCSRSYWFDDSLVGRKARCKDCGQPFALTPSAAIDKAARAAAPPLTPDIRTLPHRAGPGVPPAGVDRPVRRQAAARLGAFGTVYRAVDPVLGREVALKVPQAGLLQSPVAVERFLREARAVAQLRHPHIVMLFETGIDRGEHYLATEFIEGTTLAEAVYDSGLEPCRAAEITTDLAEALHFAHAQGIVHRDVKPANVMLDKDGRPRLMDFGLARFEGASGEKLTQDGAILGTPAYMAPEQATASGMGITAASDQYAALREPLRTPHGTDPVQRPPGDRDLQPGHRDPPPPRRSIPTSPRARDDLSQGDGQGPVGSLPDVPGAGRRPPPLAAGRANPAGATPRHPGEPPPRGPAPSVRGRVGGEPRRGPPRAGGRDGDASRPSSPDGECPHPSRSPRRRQKPDARAGWRSRPAEARNGVPRDHRGHPEEAIAEGRAAVIPGKIVGRPRRSRRDRPGRGEGRAQARSRSGQDLRAADSGGLQGLQGGRAGASREATRRLPSRGCAAGSGITASG